MTTGQRIAERRKALDLTQAQLAERLGIMQNAVSRIERSIDLPVSILIAAAKAMGCEPADLLGETSG